MRQTFRVIAVLCLSLLSLDIVVWVVDWLTRWEWLENLMKAHPITDSFVHTPFAYLALLALGFTFLRAEKWLKQPHIVGRFINSRIFPNIHKTTMQTVFNEGKPGAELEKRNWEWFIEILCANDSETPTTTEDVKVRIMVGHKWWRKKAVKVEHIKDMQWYKMDLGMDEKGNSIPMGPGAARYARVNSLLEEIAGKPLTKGIGHRGWLRLDVEGISLSEMHQNRVHLDVWLIDALEGKHKVSYSRKSQKQWDRNFLIFEDDVNPRPHPARRL